MTSDDPRQTRVIKVYSTDNLILAGLVRSVLRDNDIDCVIKNEFLSGGIGELPPIACWPEVWVLDDSAAAAALRVIAELFPNS